MSVIVVVVALHAMVFWLLSRTVSRFVAVPESTSLSLLYLTPKQGNVEAIRSPPMRPPMSSEHPSVEAPLAVEPGDPGDPNPTRSALDDESNTIHPSIDWASELDRKSTSST